MIHSIIKLLLIALILFTPLAFGSMEIWAYSLMELGILLIVILRAVQAGIARLLGSEKSFHSEIRNPTQWPQSLKGRNPQSAIPVVLLALFLLLVLFQMISLPSGILKILSPKTFALRQLLSISNLDPSALSLEHSSGSFPLS